MDRQPFDPVHPPRLVETVFEVEGAAMNAIVYEAQGPGPHPTVILLHGFPGNEKNLDLAQAMRRAGWNVVFFHYRGSWGSGGRFSFGNILEDVAGVVDAVAGPAFAARHRVDPDRIALVGHSMGGFAALVSAGELERVDCVASLAGANLGVLAQLANASEDGGAGMAARLDGWSGPIRGATGTELVEEVAVHLVRFDTTTHVPVLVGKSVLLIAGRDDEVTPVALHHLPMVEALQAAGARDLQHEVFEASDHSFSGSRIALAHRLVRWLDQSCRPLP